MWRDPAKTGRDSICTISWKYYDLISELNSGSEVELQTLECAYLFYVLCPQMDNSCYPVIEYIIT
ncbi:MAG: hypothetical protein PWQ63_222 [Methanolobus sp.]|nr:hypothetical protein [Methanolobus sp.]MDK2947062.1 hypothetical protein [Methanolobus sp.]